MAAAKSPRRRAREFLVQGLYQAQIADQDAAAIQVQAESVGGFDKVDRKLYDALLTDALSTACWTNWQPYFAQPNYPSLNSSTREFRRCLPSLN